MVSRVWVGEVGAEGDRGEKGVCFCLVNFRFGVWGFGQCLLVKLPVSCQCKIFFESDLQLP